MAQNQDLHQEVPPEVGVGELQVQQPLVGQELREVLVRLGTINIFYNIIYSIFTLLIHIYLHIYTDCEGHTKHIVLQY